MRSSSDNTSRWLWLAAAVSLGLSLTPWGETVLYPFKLFTTWVHECGHAVAIVLAGGRVMSITIQPDGSGLTESLVPTGRLARAWIASSGYLAASLVGCLLMAATRADRWAQAVVWAIGAFMLVTLVIWMRNLFGFFVVLAWGGVLIALARGATGHAARFVLSLLAIQVALNAVYDIRVLFLLKDVRSDADTMASLFLLPSWVWASLWMGASVALLAATVWLTRGGVPEVPKGAWGA